jgi:hypothetical protein
MTGQPLYGALGQPQSQRVQRACDLDSSPSGVNYVMNSGTRASPRRVNQPGC